VYPVFEELDGQLENTFVAVSSDQTRDRRVESESLNHRELVGKLHSSGFGQSGIRRESATGARSR